jgi:hypothetical protein
MPMSKQEFQEMVQSEIDNCGDWQRSRVLSCDLGACLQTAIALDQPIHYVANTTNNDYTVTIGNGGNVDEIASDFVSWCVGD